MDIGLVGLGKMGGNMRTRLRNAGHTVVGYDRNPDVADVDSLEELVEQLPAPKVVWVMVPAGDPTRDTVAALGELLGEGDLVVDGGNSRWTDDQANAELLAPKGIGFVDCGVSGGVWGLQNGYALMYGGSDERHRQGAAALRRAQARGRVRLGPRRQAPGAGHFAKMVHNGIEYAIMQAYAEGWELLEKVDLVDNVTEVFRLLARGHRHPLLAARPARRRARTTTRPRRDQRATPRTPARAAGPSRRPSTTPCPLPVITASLFARFVSRQDDSPAMKAIAAMRNQFGGHAVRTEAPPGGDANPDGDEPRPGHSEGCRDGCTSPTSPCTTSAPTPTSRSTSTRASTAFIGRNGQGKTNLVEAIDYLSRLSSHRVATDAPLVRAGADQAVVRAAVVRDGRTRRPRDRDQPGPVQPGPDQQVAAPPRPRAARAGPHGGLLPRGPHPGQGRPHRAAPVPRRPAGAAHAPGSPGSAPTTTACSGSATRC